MQGAEILTKFTADTSQVDKATKSFSSSVASLTKAFTLGNLAAKGISKAISVMTSSMDSAIKRVDILNNFPKVMSNLGIGAEDAEDAVNTLSEKLQGLPTSLDSAAMAVQRFTSANGDVKKSTKEFLALNNALLAGGASADIQSTALEQISQAYAKGKPDMMEWRSMMTAMPAQLKQVASAMGYVDASALGEALRDGSVSMDQFMQTITKLNTQGVNGFQSFEEQAKNSTGGINTSITNMKTAFTRGVASIIVSADEALQEFGGLSGVITKVGKVGEKVFKALGKVISKVIPIIAKIVKWIKEHHKVLEAILVPLAVFIATFKTIGVVVNIINTVKAAMTALFVVLKANPIGLLISAIGALVAAFVWLWNNCEDFRNFFVNMWNNIKLKFELAIEGMKLIMKVFIEWIKVLWSGVKEIIIKPIQTAVDKVKGIFESIFDKVKNVVEKIKKAFETIGDAVKGVFEGIKEMVKKIFETVIEVIKAPINALIDGVNWIIDKINNIEIAGHSPNIKHIPSLNVGTNYVPQDTLAYIHKGEAVVPKKFNPYANGINPNTINNMSVVNPNITIQIENNMEFDALGQMINKVKTFSGGAKNDFNYGMGR